MKKKKVKWKDMHFWAKFNLVFMFVAKLVFGISVGFIAGGAAGFGLFYVHSLDSGGHPFNYLMDVRMNVYSTYDRNNSYVVEVTEYCALFDVPIEQASCVIHQTCALYNATPRDDSIIRTPDELILEGGLCRDYAVFVDAIMENLGWDTDFIFSRNHVYNAMYKNDTYCTINACYYNCQEFG